MAQCIGLLRVLGFLASDRFKFFFISTDNFTKREQTPGFGRYFCYKGRALRIVAVSKLICS